MNSNIKVNLRKQTVSLLGEIRLIWEQLKHIDRIGSYLMNPVILNFSG